MTFASQPRTQGTAELQQREASGQSPVIPGSPRGLGAAMNPFSLPKTARGGELRRLRAAAAASSSSSSAAGRAGGWQAARSWRGRAGNQKPVQVPGLAATFSGLLGALWFRRALGRHGVVRGFSQLPLRIRHPPYRADPQPQSGAHQPRGAARHPRLRDRVSGRLGPAAGPRIPLPAGLHSGQARTPAAAVGLGAAAAREEEGQLLAGSPPGEREPAASLRARRLPGAPFLSGRRGLGWGGGRRRRGAEGRPGLGRGGGPGCQRQEVTSGWWDSLTGRP